MTTLRVATLNIWGRNGPWPHRLRLVRRELANLQPDIIGMQEVMRREGACQASEIADGLGYEIAYTAASEREDGQVQGNAVLSRLPIREQRSFALPVGDAEPRVLLYARVETGYGDLPVFVTHLNQPQNHGSVRLKQVRFIVARAAELAPRGQGLPPVIMGDFNADPESDEIRYLCGLAVVDGTSVYFADAWTYGGDGSPGATFDRANDYARQAREPSRRIDFIFTGGDDLLRGEPLHAALAFTEAEVLKGIRVWPSDHFGVVSDIVLAPRA
jgi:endonuclease/exonuclease/phosphatase family metal-dependent hydrolase